MLCLGSRLNLSQEKKKCKELKSVPPVFVYEYNKVNPYGHIDGFMNCLGRFLIKSQLWRKRYYETPISWRMTRMQWRPAWHMQKEKQLFGKTCLPFHFFSYRFVQYGMTNELGEVQISVTQFSCWWSSKRGHLRSHHRDLVNLKSGSPKNEAMAKKAYQTTANPVYLSKKNEILSNSWRDFFFFMTNEFC